jgi:antitoxin MazE
MKTKVQKWGNSLAVRIPKPFAEEIGLEPNTPVEVSVEEGKLVVSRSQPSSMSLEHLVEGITPDNLHREVDTGTAVGNEAW